MVHAVLGRHATRARLVVVAVVTSIAALTVGAPTASAAEDPELIEWSTTWTQEETVTVTETAAFEGYVGTGTATSTKSATATGSASGTTYWEVYYWAIMNAYTQASADAKAAADAEARPIARERAEADARAKAAAGPEIIEWSTEATVEETVTVTETATFDGYVGTGTATSTKSATATGSASGETYWEVHYWATMNAYTQASTDARAAADAEARPIAKERAEADARAKAAAGPEIIEWSTEATEEATFTANETVTVDGSEGYGIATVTRSATATGHATGETQWEVNYWATLDAHAKATAAARAAAEADARAQALQLAQEDAQAQADAPTACGRQVLKADGTPWSCTFDDPFRGTELDADTWSPVDTLASNFSYGDCFFGDGRNIAVSDGSLHLTTSKGEDPVTCELPDRQVEADYTSAAVTSIYKFSQTYGRVEIRAAMPETDGPGMQSALWMVPDEPAYYGGWPHSGEIDIAEFYSNYDDRVIPTLHYDSQTPFAQRTNNQCFVDDPTAFHTYVLEWTTEKITISVDGTTCLDHPISATAPLSGSAPFDRPFNLNLTQMLGSGDNTLPAGVDAADATLSVDYVRVWS